MTESSSPLNIAGSPVPGMSPELQRSIDDFIAKNKVVVFMKGEKSAPQVRHSNDDSVTRYTPGSSIAIHQYQDVPLCTRSFPPLLTPMISTTVWIQRSRGAAALCHGDRL